MSAEREREREREREKKGGRGEYPIFNFHIRHASQMYHTIIGGEIILTVTSKQVQVYLRVGTSSSFGYHTSPASREY